MKTIKLLFFTISLLFALSTKAQITKRNWLVGGSANFSSTTAKLTTNTGELESKATGFQIVPNVGYFFIDKLAVGTSVGFSFYNPSGDNNNSSGYSVSPFVRYYLLNSENRVNILTHLGYSFSHSKTENGFKSDSNGFLLSAGPVIYFNSSVGLELTLNYNTIDNNDTNYSNLFLGVGFQIHLKK